MVYKILRLVDGKNTISFLSPISIINNHLIGGKWYFCTGDDTCPICNILPKKTLNKELRHLFKMSKFAAYAIVDGEEGIINLPYKQYLDPLIQIGAFDDDVILNNDIIIRTNHSTEFHGIPFTRFDSIDKIKVKNPRTILMDKINIMGKKIPEEIIDQLIVDITKANLLNTN